MLSASLEEAYQEFRIEMTENEDEYARVSLLRYVTYKELWIPNTLMAVGDESLTSRGNEIEACPPSYTAMTTSLLPC